MLNAEWPWHRFGVTGVYSSVLMMTGLSINVLGPVGPVLMRHLSASPHSIGSIYSAEGLGNSSPSRPLPSSAAKGGGHQLGGHPPGSPPRLLSRLAARCDGWRQRSWQRRQLRGS